MDILLFARDLLVFFVILSILVLIHELGHFLAARRAGIKVEEFGFGFPPRVWGKQVGETIYSINALPFGGFVRLYGEDAAVSTERERSFFSSGKLVRTSIVAAGVLMNILLAILAFTPLSWVSGVPQESGSVTVTGVEQNSPANRAGIRDGDVVLSVGGEKVTTSKGFQEIVAKNRGRELEIVLKRGDLEEKIRVTPRTEVVAGQGAIGIAMQSVELVHPPLWQRPFTSIIGGAKEAWYWARITVQGVVSIVSQAIHGHKAEGLAGPIGIFQITQEVSKQGIFAVLSLIGILSVNLAILNILPFPALDGGRLFFILIEAIIGRRVGPNFERWTHTVGMVLLLTLLLLVSLGDVARIITGGSLFPASQ